jgi:hypothetical protein
LGKLCISIILFSPCNWEILTLKFHTNMSNFHPAGSKRENVYLNKITQRPSPRCTQQRGCSTQKRVRVRRGFPTSASTTPTCCPHRLAVILRLKYDGTR